MAGHGHASTAENALVASRTGETPHQDGSRIAVRPDCQRLSALAWSRPPSTYTTTQHHSLDHVLAVFRPSLWPPVQGITVDPPHRTKLTCQRLTLIGHGIKMDFGGLQHELIIAFDDA